MARLWAFLACLLFAVYLPGESLTEMIPSVYFCSESPRTVSAAVDFRPKNKFRPQINGDRVAGTPAGVSERTS